MRSFIFGSMHLPACPLLDLITCLQMNFKDGVAESRDQVHDLYSNYRPGSLTSFNQVLLYFATLGYHFVFAR